MTYKTVLSVSITLTVLWARGPVEAAEITLLARWHAGVSFGTPIVVESAWPALLYLGSDNEFIAPLFEDLALPPEFPVYLSDSVSADNDPDFGAFSTRLTDGVDQGIVLLAWTDDFGPIGGGGTLESSALEMLVPSFGPDLTGYTIDHITQLLNVDLESPGSDPCGDGIWTDWSAIGTYEFYGTPVPEPGTGSLLLLCSIPVASVRLSR